jgi:hypothetical protein
MKFIETEGPRPASAVSVSAPPGAADEDMGQNDGLNAWRGTDQLELYKSFITPSTTSLFDEFLKRYPLTRKATLKLRNFYMLTIHPLIVSGNIPTERDEAVLLGIFNRAMAELPLGLTRFDMTPNFHQVVILTRLHFVVQLQKARKGRTFDALTRTRQDVYNYEAGNVQPARRSFLQTFGILGGR